MPGPGGRYPASGESVFVPQPQGSCEGGRKLRTEQRPRAWTGRTRPSSPVPTGGCCLCRWPPPRSFLPLTLISQSRKGPCLPSPACPVPTTGPGPRPVPRSAVAELQRQSRGLARPPKTPTPTTNRPVFVLWSLGVPGVVGCLGSWGVRDTPVPRAAVLKALPRCHLDGASGSCLWRGKVPPFFCPPSPPEHTWAPVAVGPGASWGASESPGFPPCHPPGSRVSCLTASHSEGRWGGRDVKPGESVTGREGPRPHAHPPCDLVQPSGGRVNACSPWAGAPAEAGPESQGEASLKAPRGPRGLPAFCTPGLEAVGALGHLAGAQSRWAEGGKWTSLPGLPDKDVGQHSWADPRQTLTRACPCSESPWLRGALRWAGLPSRRPVRRW